MEVDEEKSTKNGHSNSNDLNSVSNSSSSSSFSSSKLNKTTDEDKSKQHTSSDHSFSQQQNDSANNSQSQDSSDSKPKRKKTIDRGLDGGYWSRMQAAEVATSAADDASSERRKRTRTNVERLDLSITQPSTSQRSSSAHHNLSADDYSLNSDDINNDDRSNKSYESTSKKDRFVLFKSKSFLAVRNETGSFFLCQACHSIYEDSKKCKIQWMEELGDNKYKYGMVDWVDPFAIISKVAVNRVNNVYRIDNHDLKKVNDLLEKAIKDGGIFVEFSTSDSSSSDEDSSDSKENNSKKLIDNKELYDKEDDDDDKIKKSKKISPNNNNKKKKVESSDSSSDEDDKKTKKNSNNNINNNKKPVHSISSSSSDSEEIVKHKKKKKDSSFTDIKKKPIKPNDSYNSNKLSDKKEPSKQNNEPKKASSSSNKNEDDTDEMESDEEIKRKNSIDKMTSNNKKPNQPQPTLKSTAPLPQPPTSVVQQTVPNSHPSTTKSNQLNGIMPPPNETQINKKRKLLKAISNRLLEENQKVTLYTKDPFFEDNMIPVDKIPYVSPYVQSKLAFKTIYLNDIETLTKLINDFEHVPSVHISKSVFNNWIPAEYALFLENKQALELLINDYCDTNDDKSKKRIQIPEVMLEKFRTGFFNSKSLGIQFARKLTESRGSKEGNNAFMKDQETLDFAPKKRKSIRDYFSRLFNLAFEYGCSNDLFDYLLTKWKSLEINKNYENNNIFSYSNKIVYENVYRAIIYGKRKLAAHVLENAPPGHGFNAVHIEVLKADNDEDLKCQLRSNMCTKKPYANDQITPIHCACINPNVKYLKTLLSITQDFNISDKKGRKPVHFAAVCEGPIPLEYLISRVSPYELDSAGNTPLHYACLAGRSMNVEILLSNAQSKQEDDSALTTEVLIDNKYGLGGINKPNRFGRLPLHLAIQRNNYECVKILIKYGCNLEYPLPNSMGKITPLMYASQLGHTKIVRLLKENNAKVEARDRFQRTAVIHASMCGHARVLSYLLRLGANPNAIDSSSNSALHYACAYGWYYSMKLLLDAGANINLYNDWKLTPFGAAFLKGHVGICDQLLQINPSQIDINFRTDNGETLVMLSVSASSILNEASVDQLNYVVNKLGGNCQLIDSNGNNAFHYLASNKCDETVLEEEIRENNSSITDNELKKLLNEKLNQQNKYRAKMADILFKGKCNPNKENNELESPLFTAVQNLNHSFARFLLTKSELNCRIKPQQNPNGKTLLSLMSEKCVEMDICHIIFGNENEDHNLIEKYANEFEQMAKMQDANGLTPFQIACLKIADLVQSNSSDPNFIVSSNILKFVLFLYKNCKSNPNELIKLSENTSKDEEYYFELDSNSDEIKNEKESIASNNQLISPIFKLVNDKCVDLIESLYKTNHSSSINFNIYDTDGLTPLLKSIVLKQTKFAIKLLDLNILSLDLLFNQISKNSTTYLNESILQLCIRCKQIVLFEKLMDMFINSCSNIDNLDKFYQLLSHQNIYKQNFFHVISVVDTEERSIFNKNSLNILFRRLNSLFESKLSDLICSKDKLGRNPLHLCLLNRNKNRVNIDLELFFSEQISLNDNYKSKYFDEKDIFGRIPLHYLFIDNQLEQNTFKVNDLYKLNKLEQIDCSNFIYFPKQENNISIDPVELLTALIQKTKKSNLDIKDIYGYSTLHYACIKGSTICCSSLIKNGCDILNRALNDFNQPIGNTPLSSAIYFKNESLVLTILNSQKVSLKDNYYLHPREFRDECNRNDILDNDPKEPTLKWSISTNENDLYPVKYIPLYKLILSYKWEGISWLVMGDLENYGLNLFDSIEYSIISSQFGLALRLMEKYEKHINNSIEFLEMFTQKSNGSYNRTLLHTISLLNLSISNEKDDLISILKLIFMPDNYQKSERRVHLLSEFLTHRDDFGSTAIHYACYTHNFEILDIIFNYIAQSETSLTVEKLLTSYKDSSQQSAYSLFFWQIGRIMYTKDMKEKIRDYTIKYLPSHLNKLDQIAKANYPTMDMPNFIYEDSIKGKFVNDYPRNSDKKINLLSPVLFAISCQSFDMCKFLLKDLNFDVNVCDSDQICALVYAIRANNLNLCKLLLNVDYDTSKLNENKSKNLYALFANNANNECKAFRMKNLLTTLITNSNIQNKVKKIDEDEESNDMSEVEEEDEKMENDQDDQDVTLIEEVSQQPNTVTNSYDKFKFKSNIQLNAIDKNLRTIFHHLALSLDYGSFCNIEICRLLFSAFTNEEKSKNLPLLNDFLKRVDSNVITAADYAIKSGNIELYEEIKKALMKTTQPIQIDQAKINKFQVNDAYYLGLSARPNYSLDSDQFLKKYIQNSLNENSNLFQDSDYFKVDPLSNMHKIGFLVWDEQSNIPFDCILTKTDVSYGLYGMHNFYKMQLITHSYNDTNEGAANSPSKKKFDPSQMCVLFTRWGRIGDKGQYQRTPFTNFKDAKEEFCKIFKQKTGNDFIDTVIEKKKSFENKPRRYNLVKFESRCRPKLKDIEFDIFETSSTPKKTDPKYQLSLFEKSKFNSAEFKNDYRLFWMDLLDVNYLKNEINTKTKLSAEYLPLTQLSFDSILKASDILNYRLKPLIEKRMELEKLSKKEHIMEYMNLLDQINKYSNDFYELIPQMNYNYEKLIPISNERELDAQLCTINQLNNAHIACRILMGAKYALMTSQANPFDYVYSSINCKLELINPKSKEAQYILRYAWPDLKANNNKFKIKRIFKFERPGEQDRFDKVQLPNGSSKLKNRLLLWHGTGTENLISIMSKGLVKAPHDAKWTGHRFGKGIYFSDSFEASTNYSYGRKQIIKSSTNGEKTIINRNYMLLCEVALGKVKELRTHYETIDSLPSGYDSVKALGRKEPGPNNDVTLPNGCIIPLGEKIDCKFKPGESIYSRNLDNTQYVVYNESQICIRYLVQYYHKQ